MAARRFMLSGLIVVAIGVIALLWFQQNDKSSRPDSVANENSEADVMRKPSPTSNTLSTTIGNSAESHEKKAFRARIFEEYRCPKDRCASHPFVAESEDEALWMHAHGYPSDKARSTAKRLTTSELKAKAESGDLVAASLYSQRLIDENDWNGAHIALLRTVQRGNIHALYTLAYWEGKHPQHPNPLQARTMIRLAYLAGDYKSSEVLVDTFPKFNSPVEQAMVDADAAYYFRNMLRYQTSPRPITYN